MGQSRTPDRQAEEGSIQTLAKDTEPRRLRCLQERLAKAAVAKAKNTEMDALYEKLEGREGDKFVFRLAKARHRAAQDIRVVKTVKSINGDTLRKPAEVRKRWEEYFEELLNEEFPARIAHRWNRRHSLDAGRSSP